MTINVRRGVEIRKESTTQSRVYMYRDKPGYYFNAFENPVSEEFAAAAGFPVEVLAKQRIKMERMDKFKADLEREMELADSGENREVLRERGGFQVIKLPLGNARVIDADGNPMNTTPISEEHAYGLLDALAPPEIKGKKASAA